MRSLLPLVFLLTTLGAAAQRAGDKVQIESAGSWYPGKVLEVKDGQFFVSYDGWSETFNEWVGPDRIKAGAGEAPSGGRHVRRTEKPDRRAVVGGVDQELAQRDRGIHQFGPRIRVKER